MSYMACSYCGDFHDTDNGEGNWDVAKLNSPKKYDFVCGVCAEKYIDEDGRLDPNLEDNLAEAAWERQQAANLECPPVTMQEQHEIAWKQKQALS